jgi:hypothetical protein
MIFKVSAEYPKIPEASMVGFLRLKPAKSTLKPSFPNEFPPLGFSVIVVAFER